ncbi:MAG: hypothetical protein N2688_15530, partial [Burkholderiaceae bacterium]|nr:hypothetical protein [Burkholderiaceae bacterium]
MQTTFSAETPAERPSTTEHFRGIRSFVKRGGRLGPGQRRAWDELGPKFVVERRFEPGVEPLD